MLLAALVIWGLYFAILFIFDLEMAFLVPIL